jgi:hypothetical protein
MSMCVLACLCVCRQREGGPPLSGGGGSRTKKSKSCFYPSAPSRFLEPATLPHTPGLACPDLPSASPLNTNVLLGNALCKLTSSIRSRMTSRRWLSCRASSSTGNDVQCARLLYTACPHVCECVGALWRVLGGFIATDVVRRPVTPRSADVPEATTVGPPRRETIHKRLGVLGENYCARNRPAVFVPRVSKRGSAPVPMRWRGWPREGRHFVQMRGLGLSQLPRHIR